MKGGSHMQRLSLLTISLFLFVLTACGGGEEEPTPIPTVELPTPLPPATSTPTPDAGMESVISLQAQPWQWIAHLDQATGETAVPNPQSYTVTFQENGAIDVKADCNNATGTYITAGDSLTIELGPTTMAECLPGSQSSQFLTLIGSAASYNISGDLLRIDLFADAGNLTFNPLSDAPAPQPTTVPATAVPPTNPPSPPGSGIDSGSREHATGAYQTPIYTVAAGDTLYSIGLRFGLTSQQLIAANPWAANGIHPGDQLTISTTAVPVPPIQPPTAPSYERVSFASGSVAATLNGSIDNNTPKGYVLRALAGQTMNIKTQSAAEPLQITVTDVNGVVLALNGVNGQINNDATASLSYTGDYYITVMSTTPPESPTLGFTITFTVQ